MATTVHMKSGTKAVTEHTLSIVTALLVEVIVLFETALSGGRGRGEDK